MYYHMPALDTTRYAFFQFLGNFGSLETVEVQRFFQKFVPALHLFLKIEIYTTNLYPLYIVAGTGIANLTQSRYPEEEEVHVSGSFSLGNNLEKGAQVPFSNALFSTPVLHHQ